MLTHNFRFVNMVLSGCGEPDQCQAYPGEPGATGGPNLMYMNRATVKALEAIASNPRREGWWRNCASSLAAIGSGVDVTPFVYDNEWRSAGTVLFAAQHRVGMIFMDSNGMLHESRATNGLPEEGVEAFGPSGISKPLNRHYSELGLTLADFAKVDGWYVLTNEVPII